MSYFTPERKYYRGQLVDDPSQAITQTLPWQQVTLDVLPADGQVPAWSAALNKYVPITLPTGGSGTGDVVGPGSSTLDNVASFANTTGKLIKDSGIATASLILNSGSYADPSWITSLAWAKITGAPSFLTSETDPVWLTDKPSYLTSAAAASAYSPIGHGHVWASISGTPTTVAGYGISDAPRGLHVAYLPPSGSYVLATFVSGTLTTQTGLANRLDLYPFVPAHNLPINQLAIEVTTGVAGALMKIGIWENASGLPGALVVGTGDLDGSSNGVKTFAVSTTLVAGKVYWMGVHYSSNNSVRAIPVAMSMTIAYPAAGGTALSNARRATATYGLGLPDPAPAGSVNNLTLAAIMLRVA